jgi:hypothetical protein
MFLMWSGGTAIRSSWCHPRSSRNPTRRQVPNRTDFLHRLVFLLPLGTHDALPRWNLSTPKSPEHKFHRARFFLAFGNCNPLLNLLGLYRSCISVGDDCFQASRRSDQWLWLSSFSDNLALMGAIGSHRKKSGVNGAIWANHGLSPRTRT